MIKLSLDLADLVAIKYPSSIIDILETTKIKIINLKTINYVTKLIQRFLNILPKIFRYRIYHCIIYFYVSIIWLIKKLLKVSNISKLNRLINENELFIDSNIKINLSDIILFVVKFILILIIAIIGAEFLDLTIVSVQIGKLLEYLPQFFTGVIIFAAGIYLASQAKNGLQFIEIN